VDALEGKADVLSLRQDHTDVRILEMNRIQTEIKLPEVTVENSAQMPTQTRPQKGLLQRIADFFSGR